jgi:hypothetical protein
MTGIDRGAPVRFMTAAFEQDDWAAIFLKSYERSGVAQGVGPVSWIRVTGFNSVPPPIAGQHGDVRTFRIYCRLIRGFALTMTRR